MKTATITYHNVYNYGAVLQAYALQQALLKLSVENVIIDHSFENKHSGWRLKGRPPILFLVSLVRLLVTAIHYPAIQRQRRAFEAFIHNRLILSEQFLTYEALKKSPPEADLYLAGSDQLWNVSKQLKRAFFLDFGAPTVKRASYAVSMGSYSIPNEQKQPLKDLLSRFDTISVREDEAKSLLEKLLDKDTLVRVHFDPVFLLSINEWKRLAQACPINSRYILCFPMGDRPIFNQALKKLKRLTGYRTVLISTEIILRIQADMIIRDASPEKFLSLIQNAEYILTSSFHGTAFSILFNKRFFTFSGGSSPARIISLLKKLGLEERMFHSLSDINTQELDFTYCNEILRYESISAREYLYSLLQEGAKRNLLY